MARIKNKRDKQTVRMEKIKIFEGEGRTRDERETCFPSMIKNGKRQGQVCDEKGAGIK
jgi:hypothetical protein